MTNRDSHGATVQTNHDTVTRAYRRDGVRVQFQGAKRSNRQLSAKSISPAGPGQAVRLSRIEGS
jgi:hypothetical protein